MLAIITQPTAKILASTGLGGVLFFTCMAFVRLVGERNVACFDDALASRIMQRQGARYQIKPGVGRKRCDRSDEVRRGFGWIGSSPECWICFGMGEYGGTGMVWMGEEMRVERWA